MIDDKILNSGIALLTDDMLHTAGIFLRNLWIHAEFGQPVGEKDMLGINVFRDFFAGRCQRDITVVVHDNLVLFAEFFHCNADAGFLVTELICNIHGTDYGKFL